MCGHSSSRENDDAREAASTLLPALCDFSFLCYLSFWCEVLEEVNQTQKYMQTPVLSLEKCVIKIKALKIFLLSQRTNIVERAISYATEKCEDLDISIERRGRRRFRKRMPGEMARDAGLTLSEELQRAIGYYFGDFTTEAPLGSRQHFSSRSGPMDYPGASEIHNSGAAQCSLCKLLRRAAVALADVVSATGTARGLDNVNSFSKSNSITSDNQKSIDARNAWIKTDRKAKSEVILAISSTELQHVRGCNTSREVWQKLASVYASKGPARKALLLKQLMLHKMSEGGDVRDHVNKFSDIVDRLGAMDIQVNKDLLSIMLLFSLPDSYEGFKCAIESRDELLEVEALKVKILEKSEVGSNSVVELAGSVRTENQKSYKYEFNGYCFKCGKQGHKSPECPTQSKPNKPNFRRNGPDKQNKQYRQEKQCAQADDDTFAVYNTEFASIIPSSRPWILDSGCTTHLCGDKQLFKSFNEETNGRINLASQASSEIKGKGTVNLLVSNGKQLRSVGFSNTLFVPDLRSNLVSVAKITNKDCEVLFRKDSAMIMDSTGNIKFVAERRGDLYYLQEGNEEADIVEDKTNSEFLMWHCRMGHLNANDLVRVINQNTTSKITSEQLTCLSKCEVCLRGKMTRLPF
ncbi:Retrovirus-related Pol polyprotein from transposon TNT 1-94 [Eumeta japonica]|uniref:Retrovirus-related Pol polyprotein from transposon TNT 1-94 n=1 Tax=Eumeta variegata TaxID=151549 RepID=A0A4C1UP07_EUMVA|nr:Retrovirus-related Pol polyprotein from transposon TNT 1-94 [Eumeta japonica]